MALNKADVRIIYISMRVLETALPYPDEIEEIIDKCKGILSSEEILELDDEYEEIITSKSDGMKELAHKILGK